MLTLKVSFLIPEDDENETIAFYLADNHQFTRIELKRSDSIRCLIDLLKVYGS